MDTSFPTTLSAPYNETTLVANATGRARKVVVNGHQVLAAPMTLIVRKVVT